MQLNFRHGIVRHQTDTSGTSTFVRKSGNGDEHIDLVCDEAPLILTAAHAGNNYLVQFNRTIVDAWGPMPPTGQTQYLFWDVSLLNAEVTFGFTTVNPYFGINPPPSPILNDQHWYDTTTMIMKVWNGTKWIPKIRVFAATYNSSAVIIPRLRGTQINKNDRCEAGNIMIGKNNTPLRDSDGTFVTSESNLRIHHTTGENVRFDTAQLFAEVVGFIPAFSLVSYVSPRKVQLASYLNTNLEVSGIMTNEYFIGEVGNVIGHGLVRNEQWNFLSSQVNQPLFCGQNGEVTLTPPPLGMLQEIGYVYDADTIYLRIQLPIIL